jgi:hypothetical protein
MLQQRHFERNLKRKMSK